MHNYENYRYNHLTMAAMDASIATPILSTGERARWVFSASCYQGTNTADCTMKIWIIPATQGLGIDAAGQVAIAGDSTFCYGGIDAGMSGKSEQDPLVFCPMGQKSSIGVGFLVPPNCMVLMGVATTNANGTIIGNMISAEI